MRKWLHNVWYFSRLADGRTVVKPMQNRKGWSSARYVVEPKHFVDGFESIDLFHTYRERKPWKVLRARLRTYGLKRGYQ